MINDFDVIHMGGRTYNPVLGRFMQADPFIQAPSNLQSFNRYSYVFNNPMSNTDPSGYISISKILSPALRPAIRLASKVIGKELTNIIGSAVFYKFGGPFGTAYWTYNFSRVHGASSTGALRSAAIAGATAGVLEGVGNNAYWGASGSPQNIFANAMVGGISAELQGGKFGHGFVSAGVASAFKPMLNDIGGDNSANAAIERGDVAELELYKPHRIAGAAIIGGTASVISGGKFANGAITGAFTQMYNAENANKQKMKIAQESIADNQVTIDRVMAERMRAAVSDAKSILSKMSHEELRILFMGHGHEGLTSLSLDLSKVNGLGQLSALEAQLLGGNITTSGVPIIISGTPAGAYGMAAKILGPSMVAMGRPLGISMEWQCPDFCGIKTVHFSDKHVKRSINLPEVSPEIL